MTEVVKINNSIQNIGVIGLIFTKSLMQLCFSKLISIFSGK